MGEDYEDAKFGWSGTPVATIVGNVLNVPVAFDTDVNAAALAECSWVPWQDAKPGSSLQWEQASEVAS